MKLAPAPTPLRRSHRADPATAPGPPPGSDRSRTPRWTPQRRGLAAAVVAAVVAACLLVHGTADEPLLVDLSYHAVLVAAGIAAWWGASRAPSGERLVRWLIACGVSLSAMADVVWTLIFRIGGDTAVSVADLTWGASYVAFAAAAVVVLHRHRYVGRDLVDSLVDVLTIVVVGVVVLWNHAVAGIVTDTEMSTFARAVQAAYPIADAVLLALVVRVLLSRHGRRSLGLSFAVGIGLWLAADVAYVVWPPEDGVAPLMDAAWMIGSVLMAWATWSPRSASSEAPERHHEHGVLVPQLVLAVVPLLVPPALEVVADLRGERDRPVELLISMALLVGLALVRTARLLRSERTAHHDLERARDAALEASEAKSVFLANMGHEIRTPLTSVLASAEMLEDTALDPVQRQLVGRMQRSGGLLRDLVERVLDFSRLAGGQVVLRPTAFDPTALVADVVEAYEQRARSQGLELTSYVAPGTPTVVTADLVRVLQVLTNLMDNALKFTEHGSIRLELGPVDAQQDLVGLRVVDTGIGILAEDQERVFDLFEQVDGSMTRSYGGSGLGLAICKQLATAMGGSIAVSSRDGEGSCFELRLPVAAVERLSPA